MKFGFPYELVCPPDMNAFILEEIIIYFFYFVAFTVLNMLKNNKLDSTTCALRNVCIKRPINVIIIIIII